MRPISVDRFQSGGTPGPRSASRNGVMLALSESVGRLHLVPEDGHDERDADAAA